MINQVFSKYFSVLKKIHPVNFWLLIAILRREISMKGL